MNSGIYEIVNKVNGKRYIGSAINFNKRWREHKRRLKNNNHHSRKLQNAYNKYGIESFTFDIIHECPVDMLIICEQWMIDQYHLKNDLYNISPTAGSQLGTYHSEETKKKISDSKRGKTTCLGYEHTEETRKKMSESHKGNKGFWEGKKRSEETKKKISDSLNGKTHSEESKKKMSIAGMGNTRSLGHIHSPETRKKISESLKSRKLKKSV